MYHYHFRINLEYWRIVFKKQNSDQWNETVYDFFDPYILGNKEYILSLFYRGFVKKIIEEFVKKKDEWG